MSTVTFLPSQIGGARGNAQPVPIPNTGNPFMLLGSDILYPSPANLFCLGVHAFLFFYQLAFIVGVILSFILHAPLPWFVAGAGLAITINWAICRYCLNGPRRVLHSTVDLSSWPAHPKEFWIFLNGVTIGSHWLQQNLNRLAYTFRRPITGVHNTTAGLIFDIVQCLTERNFSYSTQDIRDGYAQIKAALLDARYEKVVFILHSQGGIEGGLIVDWLLAEVPQDCMRKLEVYTFGALRRRRRMRERDCGHGSKVIRHIEHYANDGDLVAQWGLVNFIRVPNRFMGTLLQRRGGGHLLNLHYLHAIFPLDKKMRVLENNEFMDAPVRFDPDGVAADEREGEIASLQIAEAEVMNINSPVDLVSPDSPTNDEGMPRRVRDFSRLWRYRNGGSPRN
ncbi:hypothetical protein H2199_002677 [Coniosporium tulheliwenetii]|uniref:Uncharacterized protein n=1 Tax=Coniosporium tulheliwenetii TaxID=3383036 RepID=A0ACC2ZGS8_9PEZI|nr:hypothetical protein H2199_002677 [Cladosporium sp. JES 115]